MKFLTALEPISRETFSRFCRLLYDRHLVTGVGGNVSARTGKHFFMTPSGVSLRDIRPTIVVVVDQKGNVLSGEAPSRDMGLHLAVLRKRPDVNVVCHIHNAHIIAASAILAPGPDSLPPLTPGFVFYAHPLPMLPFMLPGSHELAEAAAKELSPRTRPALLLQNHGLITVGNNLPHAVNVAEEVEEAARILVLTRGTAKTIPEDQLSRIRGKRKADTPSNSRPQ
jgi:ribulose-5-phosphate 4-epimerase/fuculose-1-phosphate aldolase